MTSLTGPALGAACTAFAAVPALAQSVTLDSVKTRDTVRCGTSAD